MLLFIAVCGHFDDATLGNMEEEVRADGITRGPFH